MDHLYQFLMQHQQKKQEMFQDVNTNQQMFYHHKNFDLYDLWNKIKKFFFLLIHMLKFVHQIAYIHFHFLILIKINLNYLFELMMESIDLNIRINHLPVV